MITRERKTKCDRDGGSVGRGESSKKPPIMGVIYVAHKKSNIKGKRRKAIKMMSVLALASCQRSWL